MLPPRHETAGGPARAFPSPGIKLAAVLVLVGFTALLPRQVNWCYLVPASLVLGAALWSRPSLRHLVGRLLAAEFFILGTGLLALFSPASRPLFLAVFLKSNLCAAAMALLTWTTPFHELLGVLRRLRLPGVMLSTLALMIRYLPLLAGEAHRMQRARASRTFRPRRRIVWASLAEIIGRLFLRSANRAERIYLAMCARGWR
jgi:cobalt/nickel transport system permease protein